MEEWLVAQMKVRPVSVVTRDIHQPVNGAQRLDQLGVRHPALVLVLSRRSLGERGAWSRFAMPIGGFVASRHRNDLDG
jgi:hypothetical protein